jgi:hypothetical protein
MIMLNFDYRIQKAVVGLRLEVPEKARCYMILMYLAILLCCIVLWLGLLVMLSLCVLLVTDWLCAPIDKDKIIFESNRANVAGAQVLRSEFKKIPLISVKPLEDHTHGQCAADRTSAVQFSLTLAADVGMDAYFVAKSNNNHKHGEAGSREYFWMKDVNVPPESFDPSSNSLVIIIDTDFYMDMPHFLLLHNQPVLIYTFQLDRVCRSSNPPYTFDDQSNLIMGVSGGASYKHQLWSYGSDCIKIHRTYPPLTKSFLVERRKVNDHRGLVLLVPQGTWEGPECVLANSLYASELRRLVVAHGKFLRLHVLDEKMLKVSTGLVYDYNSITIPIEQDEAVAFRARTSATVKLTLPIVRSVLDEDYDKVSACALVEYHRSLIGVKPATVYPVSIGPRTYQFEPSNYEPEAKPSVVGFMSPIVHGAFNPAHTLSNERNMVAQRIIGVKSKVLKASPFVLGCMREFARLLIPDSIAHTLSPVTPEEVAVRQSKPSQRQILSYANLIGRAAKFVGSVFMKPECYANIKPPRPITTVKPDFKLLYSSYMYAFSTLLKGCEWYAFGLSPADIARRVTDVCKEADAILLSDFKRFDGSVSNLMRLLERICLLRAFRSEYKAVVSELHEKQQGAKCYTRYGVSYQTEFARLSGSPETAVMNSIDNAFTAYLAIRMTKNPATGLYYTPEEAWILLGFYGGDDGLTGDLDPDKYLAAASILGAQLSLSIVRRGQGGVTFLSRYWSSEVWTGDMNSCCDVKRQLMKFHVTTNVQGVDPITKLIEKCRSYILTDANTPIIGEIAQKIVGTDNCDYTNLYGLRSWWSQYDKSEQFPNEDSGWMEPFVLSQLPDFDFDTFREWLEGVSTNNPEHTLSPPLCTEPETPVSDVPAVIEEEVIGENQRPSNKHHVRRGVKRQARALKWQKGVTRAGHTRR